MANLVRPDDNSHSVVIIAMANAGYNIKLFNDELEAVGWLEE